MSETTQLPSLEEINRVRLETFRPTVVACLTHQRKVLLVFKKKYRLWLLPQGGVDNQEDLPTALFREVKEELGNKFALQLKDIEPTLLGEDRLEFKRAKINTRELVSDDGEELKMKGKHYYLIVAEVKNINFDLEKSEFDRVVWADYKKAKQTFDRIYFKNKKEVLQKAINLLKKRDLIE